MALNMFGDRIYHHWVPCFSPKFPLTLSPIIMGSVENCGTYWKVTILLENTTIFHWTNGWSIFMEELLSGRTIWKVTTIWTTLPKTNSSPLKMVGFPSSESPKIQGASNFRGELLVSGSVPNLFSPDFWNHQPHDPRKWDDSVFTYMKPLKLLGCPRKLVKG